MTQLCKSSVAYETALQTCFSNSNINNNSFVPLGKVFWIGFENERSIFLFGHFKNPYSVSICQPGDEGPKVRKVLISKDVFDVFCDPSLNTVKDKHLP